MKRAAWAIGLGMALMAATGGLAQEAAPAKKELLLELNALQPSENGCRISFLATNNLGAGLDRAAFEVALFNAEGAIQRLVALDFKGLIAGKTKVLQFNLPDTQCDGVGRVLINDVSACAGEGIEPGQCLAALVTSTKTNVTFGL